jgi:hypothetical protein
MICSSVKRFFTSNLRRLGDWTPNRRATQNRGDVGLVRLISSNLSVHERKLKEFFNDVRFRFPHLWGDGVLNDKGKVLRDACKKAVHELCEEIERLTGKQRDRVREDLMRYLIIGWNDDGNSVVQFIGGLVHS